ncbi:MAG TPA: hypothetical protein VGP43_10285 [Chitinophagaceae bacterium]|nr:hypothetical protein [Chitinophagaceae bacterium]
MSKKNLFSFFVLITVFSCGKKRIPEKTIPEVAVVVSPKNDSVVVVKKKTFTPKKKDIIPNSIVVNDKAAKKAIDGRLYYDLLGHRYWKNYKDGKYYLFNQKMYDNPAFKPPK